MTDRDPAVVNAGGTLNTLVSAPMTFRNAIINGAFDVWQRSTDATVTGSDSYASADRWRLRTAAGAGSVRSSRQSTGLNGFQYCMRFQRVSGNTNTAQLQLVQTLETANSIPLVGGNVVLSFWARAGANYSPTSSALSVNLVSGTGTDQYWLSFTGAATVISTTATLSSTWQRFIYIGTPATTATQFYVQFEMNPTGTAGANDFFEITGVQLEQNSQATPFERRPFGVELAICKRYYEKSFDYDVAPADGVYSGSYISNIPFTDYWVLAIQWVAFSVEKRRIPDMSWFGSGGKWQANNSDNSWTTFAQAPTASAQGVMGLKKTGFSMGIHNNGANGYNGVAYSRMVRGDWVASAEL